METVRIPREYAKNPGRLSAQWRIDDRGVLSPKVGGFYDAIIGRFRSSSITGSVISSSISADMLVMASNF